MNLDDKRFGYEERIQRIKILTDLIFSFHEHLGGRYRHSRIPELIVPTECILIGKIESDEKERKIEHLVPLACLLDECFKILETDKSASKEKITKILDRFLVVLDVPKSVQMLLDEEYKCVMPKDWNVETGDVFSRFKNHSYLLEKIKFNSKWNVAKGCWILE